MEMKKIEILMDKSAYLGVSILELSKILMYEICGLRYMGTDSLQIYCRRC